MTFLAASPQEDLSLNQFRIKEPLPTAMAIAINDLDCLFIPLVAFDTKGYRLGMGQGYYDRALTSLKKKPPCTRLRPGTLLEKNVKIGNFVEVKKTHIGQHSKANHLSYLGDAIIGEQVNIGAGTITCNYDGVNKHQTIIEDGAFIGSDTQLVAPVRVGKNATIGAGTTIRRDAPAEQLTLSEVRQKTIPGWKRPIRQDK